MIMSIGENYANDFLLKEDYGGGCYLEYHDTPHFHKPITEDSSGYLILGKVIHNKCHLNAFSIPYGYGIYTPPFVIHCDGFLIGKYMVVYTFTPNYSTVILKHNNKITNIEFI